MKHVIILCALILAGCSSKEDWDSGGQASQAFEQQREEEQIGTLNDQFPDTTQSGTERALPH